VFPGPDLTWSDQCSPAINMGVSLELWVRGAKEPQLQIVCQTTGTSCKTQSIIRRRLYYPEKSEPVNESTRYSTLSQSMPSSVICCLCVGVVSGRPRPRWNVERCNLQGRSGKLQEAGLKL
jgi:hypothetical protein